MTMASSNQNYRNIDIMKNVTFIGDPDDNFIPFYFILQDISLKLALLSCSLHRYEG